jgi:diguanylate cyclase (GGDEF)-like protein
MLDQYIIQILNIGNILVIIVLLVVLVIIAALYIDGKNDDANRDERPVRQLEKDRAKTGKIKSELKDVRQPRTLSVVKPEQTEEEHEIDELTGAYGRNYFNQVIQNRIDSDEDMSVIYGDINGLRQYNWRKGFKNGDKQIRGIFKLLRSTAPEAAQLFRVNGAEFVLAMPEVDLKQGENICRGIRSKLSDDESLELDVALGIATATDERKELKQIVAEAEECMMKDKLLCPGSSKHNQLNLLLYLMEEKFQETELHARRVQGYAMKIGKRLQLPEAETNSIYLLSVLHDIGKICVADSILQKPGKLDLDEWDAMKQHCVMGARILRTSSELTSVSHAVLCHHENWDGTGYPMGLRNDEIPLLARIIRVVDSYDAMTNVRVYSGARSHEDAAEEMRRCSGTHFDPRIVEIFLEILEQEQREAAA